MRFVWRMALRELRAGWRRLLFFFLCLSIGVGSVVALRSTIQIARCSAPISGSGCDRGSVPTTGRGRCW